MHTYIHMHTHIHVHIDIHIYAYANTAWCIGLRSAIHCNTLQHTATHCNTLQHSATHGCTGLQSRGLCARALDWCCHLFVRVSVPCLRVTHDSLCDGASEGVRECTRVNVYVWGWEGASVSSYVCVPHDWLCARRAYIWYCVCVRVRECVREKESVFMTRDSACDARLWHMGWLWLVGSINL